MANLEDYIGWRGDVSFSYDPFNEVDNLVFSVLSYAPFDDVLDSSDLTKKIPLRELSEKFFAVHSEQELLSHDIPTKMFPLLLRNAGASRRFGDIMACAFENHVNTSTDAQMSAVTFFLDEHTAYVAFRGTDNSIVGWKEDFELSYLKETTGQKLAVAYLDRLFSDTCLELCLGGHSKGGNFAVYAGAFCSDSVKNQIRRIYTNDAPGFRPEIICTDAFQSIRERIINIIPETSIIGTLLETTRAQHIVKSSNKGIMQHDALSWQVYGNHFEEVDERSGSSQFLEGTIDNWVSSFDDPSRRQFVEALFALLENTGHETFEDIKSHGLTSLQKIWQYSREMPASDRNQFFDALGQLVRSGKDMALESLLSGIARKLAAKPDQSNESAAASEENKALPEKTAAVPEITANLSQENADQ